MAKTDISAMPPADEAASEVISERRPPAAAKTSRPVNMELMTIHVAEKAAGRAIFFRRFTMPRSIFCPRMTPLITFEKNDSGAL